jgi:MFS family permease
MVNQRDGGPPVKVRIPVGVSRRLTPRSLRHRDYALLWSGQTVSVLGDGIYTIAIALEALRISDHPATLAYVETARVAPNALLLLLAGAIVDRLPRRLVILGADLLRGGAVAAIAVLAAAHALDVTWLVVLSAAVGTGDAFFYPAYRAVMPELLPAGLLAQGNAFNSASQTVGQSFAGPAIGGVLVALAGTSAAFAVDAASFAVSALCLVLMRHVPAPAPSGRSVAADVGQGIRWTMRQRWLWFGILAVGVSNFAGFSPMAVTIPLLVRDTLRQGPAAYGVTFAAAGAGGLAAAAVAARLGSPQRRMSMIWVAWAVASFALAGVGAAPDVFAAAACGAVTFFGVVYGNVLWGALMQTAVPPGMLGRASSVDWLFSTCVSPLGILFAGAFAGPIGVRQTILLGAGLSALSCLVVFVPGVRDPDQPGYRPQPLNAGPGERNAATPA